MTGVQSTASAPGDSPIARPRLRLLARLILGLVLIACVLWVGSPRLDAPWIQGDERIFIANNSDVTGEATATTPARPLGVRLKKLLFEAQEDLYQPIPVATYALEWALWGDGRVFFMRLTEVILHATNALLVWIVLSVLLRRFAPESPSTAFFAWSLTLVWALHPCLTATFSADMGRTHLLATLLALPALLAHIKGLETRRNAWFVLSVVLLLLAMMSKPLAGWFLIAAAIETAWTGWKAAAGSVRVYVTLAICIVFAWITLQTTHEAGMLKDSQTWLFGDPISRSFLGLTIYLRHLLWPFGLATWYPPDIHAGWQNPAVWIGLLLTLGSFVLIAFSLRGKLNFGIGLGLVWFWATILPVIGIVGARVIAAQDRYLYMPLIGLLLALGIGLGRLSRPLGQHRAAYITGTVAMLGLVLLPEARRVAADTRDSILRGNRILACDPSDPRRQENLAIAYGYVADHPECQVPHPGVAFRAEFVSRLRAAGEAAENAPRYFRNERDRAAFHRRLSWKMLENRAAEGAFANAKRAADFEPDAPMTLLTLARAYQARGEWRSELETFAKLEKSMPDDPGFRAIALTEYGDLLMTVFERPDMALERLRRALATGEAGAATALKLARCEVLAGHGETGFQIAAKVFEQDQENVAAAEVVALYHARSHHWDEAANAYRVILGREPTHYEALRGFHEVCMQTDRMNEAMIAWQDAARLDRESAPAYRSFFVWAAACSNDPKTVEWANEIITERNADRFAFLAHMLIAAREDRIDDAIEWVRKAADAPAIPRANEMQRAEATLRYLRDKGVVSAAAAIVRAVILDVTGNRQRSEDCIADFVKANADSRWKPLAEALTDSVSKHPATSQP